MKSYSYTSIVSFLALLAASAPHSTEGFDYFSSMLAGGSGDPREHRRLVPVKGYREEAAAPPAPTVRKPCNTNDDCGDGNGVCAHEYYDPVFPSRPPKVCCGDGIGAVEADGEKVVSSESTPVSVCREQVVGKPCFGESMCEDGLTCTKRTEFRDGAYLCWPVTVADTGRR